MRRVTGKLQRRARLRNASNVHLKFWAKVSSFEGADSADVEVSLGGGVFATVKTFTAADSDGLWHLHDLDLSGLALPATFKVVFDANMSAIDDSWYLDDIRIDGVR